MENKTLEHKRGEKKEERNEMKQKIVNGGGSLLHLHRSQTRFHVFIKRWNIFILAWVQLSSPHMWIVDMKSVLPFGKTIFFEQQLW